VHITASIGVALIAEQVNSIDDLLVQTKVALKRSKQAGKNRVSSESGEQGQDARASVLVEVFDAIRSGRALRVIKQPIFALADQSVYGYEFLSRLGLEGFELPHDFFRICQEHNMLGFMDQHCFHQCLGQAIALGGPLSAHVNIFPSTLLDIPLDKLLGDVRNQANVGRFCIEISEQQIIGNPTYLVKPVQVLRQAGMRIAIDDVGFGRTSLESLLVLEPDVIKIDMRFVQGVHQDEGRRRSLLRLLRIAKSLNAEVVAEGIENSADLNVLKELGVLLGQGFLWGKPA
jgi:EAL domain-containing protein (putative c-di-GMP-specific phosphodiesterase class I)